MYDRPHLVRAKRLLERAAMTKPDRRRRGG